VTINKDGPQRPTGNTEPIDSLSRYFLGARVDWAHKLDPGGESVQSKVVGVCGGSTRNQRFRVLRILGQKWLSVGMDCRL